jgi:hypothetical protein
MLFIISHGETAITENTAIVAYYFYIHFSCKIFFVIIRNKNLCIRGNM